MKTIYFNRTPINGFDSLVHSYSKMELASPYRSTIPLLSLIKDAQYIFDEILNASQMQPPLDLHFEFQFTPPMGRGTPSHTDLVVHSPSQAMAIEAKWTEPGYPAVSQWLAAKSITSPARAGQSDNRKTVLDAWLSLLRPYSNKDIRAEEFADIPYQMIHRAASACSGGRQPRLAYWHFQSGSEGAGEAYYRSRLESLYALLGYPEIFPFMLVNIRIAPTDAFGTLAQLPKAVPETASAVRNGLVSARLFSFLGYAISSIAGP